MRMENVETPEKQEKKSSKLSVFFNVLIIFLSIAALAVAGVLIYQKRYLSPFWVNGQSMYPTLNKDAVYSSGNLIGETGGSVDNGSKNVDYGVMDKHKSALDNLKRFDIVICKYDFGDEYDKIKRVIGLPGETIMFGSGDNNGKLYVKNGYNYTYVEQPIDAKYVAAGKNYPTAEITLGKDEYYVLGDNRAHSYDSRSSGAIKYEWLVGKAVAICAHCEIKQKDDGSYEPVNIKHFWPRYL